ncbi:MAG: hypothetical protein LYZ69_08350 [Nitrososphaerales archaeon]|nr:hypothetical protein [Nitrososphaerales archaeon]
MSEDNLASTAALLRLFSTPRAGVARAARDLHVGPSKLTRMVAEVHEQGLLDIDTVRTRRAGRPKKLIRATPLGIEYLDAYEALRLKTLKSRRSDLRMAVANATYATRLAARGVSPYKLFLELNALAEHPRGPSA